MKKILYTVVAFGLVYLFCSSFFIVLVPPDKNELIGKYESKYDKMKYLLYIMPNGESILTVKKDDKTIYQNRCKSWKIEKMDYRTLPIYNLSFRDCDGMDFSSIIERNLLFKLQIGNNGSELKRIDPDANIFYQKSRDKGAR